MDKDRPRQTGTDKNEGKREKKKMENKGATWQRKNKKKLRIYFKKSEDTSLGKSMDPLKFLEKFEI